TAARSAVIDDHVPEAERLRCIRVLGRGDRAKEDIALLARLLEPRVGPALQQAAVQSLARQNDPTIPRLLLRDWKAHSPTLRSQILDALLQRPLWIPALLDVVEKKLVLAQELDAARRQQLLAAKDPAVRKRAAKLLAGAIAPDRQKVIDAYMPVLKRTGDTAK